MSPGRWHATLLAAGLLLGVSVARARGEEPVVLGQAPAEGRPEAPAGEAYHLYFEIQTRLRSSLYDADLGSGGRLLMKRVNQSSPGLSLGLVEPVENPFTLFWLKVAFQDHMVRYYDVLTLPEGTPAAKAAAKRASEAFAQKVYREWKSRGGKGKLDRAFSLYVVGPPASRFDPHFGPSGDLIRVENRLTSRWLPGGLEPWFEQWGAVQGYAGTETSSPPDWEPHTYHSFARMLGLLEVPEGGAEQIGRLADPGEGGQVELVHPEVAGKVLGAIQTLVPKADLSFSGKSPAPVKYHVVSRDGGRLEVSGRSGVLRVTDGEGLRFLVTRRLTLDGARRRPIRDDLVFRAWRSGQEVSARIGYEPVDQPWPPLEAAAEP